MSLLLQVLILSDAVKAFWALSLLGRYWQAPLYKQLAARLADAPVGNGQPELLAQLVGARMLMEAGSRSRAWCGCSAHECAWWCMMLHVCMYDCKWYECTMLQHSTCKTSSARRAGLLPQCTQ